MSTGAGLAWKTPSVVSSSEADDELEWWIPEESLNGCVTVAGLAATGLTPSPLWARTFLFTGCALNWWLQVNFN